MADAASEAAWAQVIVDQFIDRTRGRPSSFFGPGLVAHVSMANPVSAREGIECFRRNGVRVALDDFGVGYSCLAEVRMIETIAHGKPRTSFLRFGDEVRIEMLDGAGQSIFGAIEQVVARYRHVAPL